MENMNLYIRFFENAKAIVRLREENAEILANVSHKEEKHNELNERGKETEITLEELREKAKQLRAEGAITTTELLEINQRFGVEKIQHLPKSQYQAYMDLLDFYKI